MKLGMIVNPFTVQNLQWAAQVGVSDIVLTYPGLELSRLLAAKKTVESLRMRLTCLERRIPHLKFVHNLPGRDAQIDDFKTLIRNMGEAGMEVLCYNWMPDEVLAGIRMLADKIFFVHARNVRGTAEHFAETWHDNGEIDMFAVIRALTEGGFRGVLRPDHAPSMAGESNETPGYEMLGRLYAAGYLRGLIHGVRGVCS